jgi:hypothetical protein
MAGAFAQGFRMGGDIYGRAQSSKLAREQEERARRESDALLEQRGLQTGALRRKDSQEIQAQGIRSELADFTQGIDRPATSQALDADFNMANQAALQGLQLPAVQGGSNAANEAALTQRAPVDPAAPEYQQRMAGLRSRLALATGDDSTFANIQQAEATRVASQQDSAFARAIMADPSGDAAKQARSFINTQSQRLSTKVDPKTGITTFAMVKGDGYDEIKINPADLGKVAVGFRRLERGDVGGLDIIAGVNKDLAAVAREEFKLEMDVGKTNNDANYKTGALANDRARLGIQQRSAQNLQRFQDADGNVVLLDVAGLPRSRDGTVQIPPNLKPINARPEFSFKDITDRARALVDSGVMDPDNPKQRLTMDNAIRIVRQEAQSGEAYMSVADRVIAALQKGEAGGAQTPTPAAAAPGGGIMRDSQGRIQLLQPFTSFNDYRRRMVEEANRNAQETEFGLY